MFFLFCVEYNLTSVTIIPTFDMDCFICPCLNDAISTRKDVGLELFFPRELINSMKVDTDPTMQPLRKAQIAPINPPSQTHTPTAQAAAAADPADLPGLLHPKPGPVHEPLLQHARPVLHLHAGELCVSTRGETQTCARGLGSGGVGWVTHLPAFQTLPARFFCHSTDGTSKSTWSSALRASASKRKTPRLATLFVFFTFCSLFPAAPTNQKRNWVKALCGCVF